MNSSSDTAREAASAHTETFPPMVTCICGKCFRCRRRAYMRTWRKRAFLDGLDLIGPPRDYQGGQHPDRYKYIDYSDLPNLSYQVSKRKLLDKLQSKE